MVVPLRCVRTSPGSRAGEGDLNQQVTGPNTVSFNGGGGTVGPGATATIYGTAPITVQSGAAAVTVFVEARATLCEWSRWVHASGKVLTLKSIRCNCDSRARRHSGSDIHEYGRLEHWRDGFIHHLCRARRHVGRGGRWCQTGCARAGHHLCAASTVVPSFRRW